jgi:hypothetical protein
MKSITQKTLGLLVLTSLLFLSSCQKSSTGPKGDSGANGNANVQASTYQVSNWTNGSDFWYTQLNVPALTAAAQSSAAVEVFLSTNNGTNWFALPYTSVNSTNYFMGFVTSINTVEIQWTYNGIGNGSSPNAYFGATCQFKVVVIPPAAKKPKVDTKNYEELKKEYNLPN